MDKEPQPGDLVKIFRRFDQHWAIYIGEGFVVHIVPCHEIQDPFDGLICAFAVRDTVLVQKDELSKVVGCHHYCVNNLLDDQYEPRPIHEILDDAHKLDNKKPRPGDLIEIFRQGYQHWAIYVGDGFAIHLAPPSEYAQAGAYSMMSVVCDKAMVKKEELYEIIGNDDYCINNLLDDEYVPRDIHDILEDAQKLVGRGLPYSVLSRNCEHFVTELRYGKAHSRQVRTAIEIGAGVLTIGAIGVGILAVASALFGSKNRNRQEE
ncbi:hypothetical protein DNTS_031238 [Danionella cerebrum]|uniref:LRAT domain-containing protein n=1 Tax=Danionella cerebrum TaxID=2873325 RepID=A0A553MNE5_9TELE|nr:hypothetical protein DNTS_031238 [Danionella translucida]